MPTGATAAGQPLAAATATAATVRRRVEATIRQRVTATVRRRVAATGARLRVPVLPDAGRGAARRLARVHGERAVRARGRRAGRRPDGSAPGRRTPSDPSERHVPELLRVHVPPALRQRAADAGRRRAPGAGHRRHGARPAAVGRVHPDVPRRVHQRDQPVRHKQLHPQDVHVPLTCVGRRATTGLTACTHRTAAAAVRLCRHNDPVGRSLTPPPTCCYCYFNISLIVLLPVYGTGSSTILYHLYHD